LNRSLGIGIVCAALALGLGCSQKGASKPLIALAQANSQDPWRQVFDAQIKKTAAQHPEVDFEEQDAQDDPIKQSNQIDTFKVKGAKVLLVSAASEAVQKSVEAAFDAGIPVILLDRQIPGDKYTAWVGGDNVDIARQAAAYIAKRLNGKGVVLMIKGKAGAGPTIDRENGAKDEFKKYPGITVIDGYYCDYQREPARKYMETFLQTKKHIDAVYAHNDEMAIGARMAWDASGQKSPAPIFVSIDGCQKEEIDDILAGKLDATFQYPVPGAKGFELALDLLKGQKLPQKRYILPTQMVTKENAQAFLKANPDLYARP